ncbi:MAG: GT4 family glycosyltransferase PelF [Armatimonadetes bacterium]|nr:GT4 family glycosyltransferase PelF [Armatimonadota bacterium]
MPFTVHVDGNRNWGGGQVQSLGLALALAARGEETRFLAHTGSALASRLAETYLPWEQLGLRGFGGVRSLPALARWLREWRPDLVHLHDSASHGTAALAARFADSVPVVATRRTVFPLRSGLIGRAKYRLCDRIICISEAIRRQCLAGGIPEAKLAVIPDFVDCRHFDPSLVSAEPTGARPTILTMGRLAPEKGHRILLRAMREVVRRVPESRLLICGEGEERAALEAQCAALGLTDTVEFAGFVSDSRAALARADIFVMPSLFEGLGVAVLEAMAMARPVVATDAGGLPESVIDGETGRVVPRGNAGALAEAMLSMLDDTTAAQSMGATGRARAKELYDRPRIVDRILDLYEDVLMRGTP